MLREKVKNILSRLNGRKKPLVLVTAVLVLALTTVGGTLALQYMKTESIKNTFTKASVTVEIPETVEDGYKKSVKVQNTGDISAYIRVAVVANTVDANGNITGNADVSGYLAGTGWLQKGDFYYYSSAVAANGTTGELLKNDIPLEGIQVTILAEGIQAEGGAAAEAWGVTINDNGTISVG